MEIGASKFRYWFQLLLLCSAAISLWNLDTYWLVLELGITVAVLSRRSSFDIADELSMQRPLTLFMIVPLALYVLISIQGGEGGVASSIIMMLTKMMATQLVSMLLILALIKRTSLRLNARFILSCSMILAVSWASVYSLISVTLRLGLGDVVTNDELMWNLLGILFFGLLSGALLKRDVRKARYLDHLCEVSA